MSAVDMEEIDALSALFGKTELNGEEREDELLWQPELSAVDIKRLTL